MVYQHKFLTDNRSYSYSTPLSPSGIVVHSTGVNQKKLYPYYDQFNSLSAQSSVHGAIGLDDTGTLVYQQWLPYNIQCWGCGKGSKGSYNKSHIQFEICEFNTDKEWTMKTYFAALELCANLCAKYNINPDNVVCHSEANALGYASNHADVMHWWSRYDLSMDKFRDDLKAKLGEDIMTKEQILTELGDQWIARFDDLPNWAKSDMRQLLDEQVLNGGTDYATDPDDINMFLSDIKSVILCKRMMKK